MMAKNRYLKVIYFNQEKSKTKPFYQLPNKGNYEESLIRGVNNYSDRIF